MKTAPRGPFKRLRHYCKDGSVLPPSEDCEPRGGGIEHGEWTDEVVLLRENGYEVANLYAIVRPERFTGGSPDLRALQQMLLERFLMSIDDGWIMRATRSYRGSVQAEDEGQGAARLQAALLGDPAWRDDARYFLLRETLRWVPPSPDADEDASSAPCSACRPGSDEPPPPVVADAPPSAADVRNRALHLAEKDPPFMAIRVKIHSVPDASDAKAVRAFAKTQGRSELRREYEELARRIDALYGRSAAPDQMRALAEAVPGDASGERARSRRRRPRGGEGSGGSFRRGQRLARAAAARGAGAARAGGQAHPAAGQPRARGDGLRQRQRAAEAPSHRDPSAAARVARPGIGRPRRRGPAEPPPCRGRAGEPPSPRGRR